jgi:uncharacterized delta-60 repeat protein
VTALTASGSVDTTFSGDGSAEVPVSLVGSFDSLRDLAVQSDGKIVLGGSSGTELASARLTATGAMDTTYSGDGVARAVVEYGGAGAKVLVQSDKKVVVVGYATGTGRSDTDLAAVRFTAAGALDPTFSGDGRALIDLGARRNERATSASLAADGKIVLVGSAESAVGMDSAIARLDWDGTVDTSFSGDGLTTVDTLGTSNEQLETVAVTATGAIRSAGSNLSGWTLLGHDGSASTNVSVADASVLEPDTGTVNATFTVTLSSPSPTPVTVKWKTAPGTATAPADFTTRSGTVTFPAGVTSRPVTVPVVGDTVREADETFSVLLSLPTNAGIADGTAVGTVRNDD